MGCFQWSAGHCRLSETLAKLVAGMHVPWTAFDTYMLCSLHSPVLTSMRPMEQLE